MNAGHSSPNKKNVNKLLNYISWSEQRARLLHTCPRSYAYRFVASWGGWDPAASQEAQYSYYCNSILPDLRLATGSIVHDRCGRVLKRLACGIQSDLSTEIEIAEQDFDKFLSDSARLPLSALGSKRKKLLAHVYEEEVPKSLISSERAAISLMLTNFFQLPEIELFSQRPDVLVRELVECEIGEPSWELGVPARLVTDAVHRLEDGICVTDWKTGRAHESHREKGIIYDIFVRGRLGLNLDLTVKVVFRYLKSGETAEFVFTPEEREEMKWRVGEEFGEMRGKSLHPVVNVAPLASFPARVDYHCLNCPHQLICPDFSNAVARGRFDKALRGVEVVR
jgi:hypothetical protein